MVTLEPDENRSILWIGLDSLANASAQHHDIGFAIYVDRSVVAGRSSRSSVPSFFPQTFYGTDPDGPTFASQLSEVTSNLGTTLKEFPTFAEWAANVTVPGKAEFAANLRPGVQDTGTVVRAFLPIDGANNRSRVMEYQGKATAVDMRVVCSAPKLTDVVYSTYTGYTITGLADIVENSTGLRQQLDADGSSNFTMSFECPFAATGTGGHEVSTPTSWPLALCRPIYWHSKKGTRLPITVYIEI